MPLSVPTGTGAGWMSLGENLAIVQQEASRAFVHGEDYISPLVSRLQASSGNLCSRGLHRVGFLRSWTGMCVAIMLFLPSTVTAGTF